LSSRKKLILSASLGLIALFAVERVVSWYLQPLNHPRFIQMLLKENALTFSNNTDIIWISDQLKEKLYIQLVINGHYDKPAARTAYLYIFEPDKMKHHFIPRNYKKLINTVKNNCRAISERKVVYCDSELLMDIERRGSFRETFAGVLLHELGHIFDEKTIFGEIDHRKDEQVAELIELINEAERLSQVNSIDKATAIIIKVRQSLVVEDPRVRDRLTAYYLGIGQYEQASKELRALIAEGKALFHETDEKYQSVLRYITLLAQCLTALEQDEEAYSLYLEVVNQQSADTYIRTLAQAGLIRSKYKDQFTRASGLVVVRVKPEQPGKQLGIETGDILTSVNGLALNLPKDLGTSLANPGLAEIQIYKSATDSFEKLWTNESRLGITVSTF
jgi:hypothetical protein